MNKTAEVIQAARAVSDAEWSESMPKTQALKSLLEARLNELNEDNDRLLREAKDNKAARTVIMNALEAIEGEKK